MLSIPILPIFTVFAIVAIWFILAAIGRKIDDHAEVIFGHEKRINELTEANDEQKRAINELNRYVANLTGMIEKLKNDK